MIKFKIYAQISNFIDTNHKKQKYTHMPSHLTCGRQRAVRSLGSLLPTYCLYVPRYTHHISRVIGLLNGFRPYIYPQTSFASQNFISNNLPSILT